MQTKYLWSVVFVQLRDPTAMANEDTYPAAFHRLHEAIRCYNGAQERAVDNRLESKAETIQRAKDNIRQARKVLNEIFSDLCKHPNKPCAYTSRKRDIERDRKIEREIN